jgi:hypothetical protein
VTVNHKLAEEMDMSILLLDPTGCVAKAGRQEQRSPGDLRGKRVGYLFNQHKSALTFWRALEQEIERTLAPAAVVRAYKENTWAPAPKTDVTRLMKETDYALVGLGA